MKREIVLDTETTGLDPSQGHRIVEVGCVELINATPTGRTYHTYINPMRDMPNPAFAVHGLSATFLADFPVFEDIAAELITFLEDSPLVIHNAGFDMKFLSAEFAGVGQQTLSNPVVDTLRLARTKYPGAPASLDMLCRRFQIDNTGRDKHGALIDAQLLAAVYLELLGGKQPQLSLHAEREKAAAAPINPKKTKQHVPRLFTISREEKARHDETQQKINGPTWEGWSSIADGAQPAHGSPKKEKHA
ncbi:DNA polymerase III subunit epsilon [Candidatus Hepatobacter penaei]|uniref:DNA polymerase III subunit epsilon n=1 Tax=Candidatus Hepatobacter penaei TaxID=1274402 RepID=UPI0009E63A24|nr:DNA polymerase III subunit epsilon [Candidatus Hepatobacter penaei]